MKRIAKVERKTLETEIRLELNLDGEGVSEIKTNLGFLDHMLESFAKHSKIDLLLKCTGDLQVDDHHTIEDCAIVLGQGIKDAIGEVKGINRFGAMYAPLDESLSRAVVDLSGRGMATINIKFNRDNIGDIATENIKHFFISLAEQAKITAHIDCLKGDNDHHKAESCFKAFALALRQAVSQTGDLIVPSTKGVL